MARACGERAQPLVIAIVIIGFHEQDVRAAVLVG